MGFYIDIAEIVGLLFAAYVVGWFVGYAAHRATARAPRTEAATAAPSTAGPVARDADALVKAPVVVPVATTPAPVLAAAAAIEPVKATAVPDSDATAPGGAPPSTPSPAPVVSALDTLKSLSTAMPLMPANAEPATVELPMAQVVVAADAAPLPTPVETTGTPEIPVVVDVATPGEPAPAPPAAPLEPASPAAIPGAAAAEPKPAIAPDEPDAPASLAALEEAAREPEAPGAKPVDATPAPVPPTPPPMPANAPGVPWAGAINGHEAQRFVAEASAEAATFPVDDPANAIPEPDAALDVALLSSIADGLKVGERAPSQATRTIVELAEEVTAAHPEAKSAAEPEAAISPTPPVAAAAAPAAEPPAPQAAEPTAPAAAAGLSTPPPVEVALPPPPPPRRPALDEDAAMRAIEGGWSRRDVRALGDAPELTDVTAAVSAAQVAVEQVLARNGVDAAEQDVRNQAAFGKPPGLPQPREGRRDSLKRIEGLGPLDEVTLNNLGIYHFDQIAKWTEREVLWLENHAFAVGRLGREGWQDQARELLAERDATRALR